MSEILTNEVILIDDTNSNLGQMSLYRAKQIAQTKNLDLIEINRQNSLSVVKIVDKGKWLYEQKKKKKSNIKIVRPPKEIKFGIKIEKHDLDIKINHIKEFLSKLLDVKVVIELFGREKDHPELAQEKLDYLTKNLEGLTKIEDFKKSSSNFIIMLKSINKK